MQIANCKIREQEGKRITNYELRIENEKTEKSAICLAILAILTILGCGREFDNPFDPNNSSYETVYIKEGWQAYRTNEIEKAKEAFNSALSFDDGLTEAYNGLGWCELRQGNFIEAGKAFSFAIAIDPIMLDAHAGLAGMSLATGEYESAIEHATLVLTAFPKYVFAHDASITYYQLRLILAEGYFQIGEYDKALKQVTLLNPDHKIVPEKESYIEDLALEIEALSQG